MSKYLNGRFKTVERYGTTQSKTVKKNITLSGAVKFLLMFSAFSLLNYLLSNLTNHTSILTFNSMRVLEQGFWFVLNDSTISFVTFVYEHWFGAVFAFVCFAIMFTLTVSMLCGKTIGFVGMRKGSARSHFSQGSVAARGAVAYKHKVCFLS